jgi:hypothetical protein
MGDRIRDYAGVLPKRWMLAPNSNNSKMRIIVKLVFVSILITTMMALGDENAPSSSSEERKTPAEWLAVVKANSIASKRYEAAHPEEAKLLLGACYMDWPHEVVNFPANYKEACAYYEHWSKTDGEVAFNKWRKDGFPLLTDPQHLILHVEAMKRRKEGKDLDDYTNRIVSQGKALLLKGCSGERLSQGELDELRLFAIYQCHNYEDELLTPGGYRGWMPSGVAPGMPAPDFTLPRMEEILERPTYSDQDPNDIMNQYRPSILTEILNIMSGYEATPDRQPGSLVRAKPYDTTFKSSVTLSSFRGKPVLFMCADATDTWCWAGRVAPMWEPLYCYIKDRVEVFFVHTTVHDFLMWGGAPWTSNPLPLTWAFHPLTLEARARTAKMFYMAYPTVTIPYLLDDTAYHLENAYMSDGGGAETFLVDKSGTVSFSTMHPEDGDNYVRRSAYGDEIGGLGAFTQNPREMSLIECNVKALLDAGGVWNKEMKLVIPDWKVSPMLVDVPLTAVDSHAGTLTVTDKANKNLVIAFDAQTRIMKNGKRITSADLKPNQTVQIMYQPDATQSGGQIARMVLIGQTWGDVWANPVSWLPAEVQAIDLKQGVVTVKMTLKVGECKGPGFWKTATPALFDNYHTGRTNSVPDTFTAVAAIEGKPLILHADRFTELFLNGMTAHLSDLKVGDKLGFDLPYGFQPDNVWPHFIRVYRF